MNIDTNQLDQLTPELVQTLVKTLVESDDKGVSLALNLVNRGTSSDIARALTSSEVNGSSLARSIVESEAGIALIPALVASDAGVDLSRDFVLKASGVNLARVLSYTDAGLAAAHSLATNCSLNRVLANTDEGYALAQFVLDFGDGLNLASTFVNSNSGTALTRAIAGSNAGINLAIDLVREGDGTLLARDLAYTDAGDMVSQALREGDAAAILAGYLDDASTGVALVRTLSTSDINVNVLHSLLEGEAGLALAKHLAGIESGVSLGRTLADSDHSAHLVSNTTQDTGLSLAVISCLLTTFSGWLVAGTTGGIALVTTLVTVIAQDLDAEASNTAPAPQQTESPPTPEEISNTYIALVDIAVQLGDSESLKDRIRVVFEANPDQAPARYAFDVAALANAAVGELLFVMSFDWKVEASWFDHQMRLAVGHDTDTIAWPSYEQDLDSFSISKVDFLSDYQKALDAGGYTLHSLDTGSDTLLYLLSSNANKDRVAQLIRRLGL